ncbi:Uncharacterised protein [Amycolatopsis camponoti]|uniref:Uncharacterized protein n=1 Tax=Amycolatopsis camponoti TaxID=2606593 RepID=A0A6I8LSF1_9PSEU|nr:hypothetical protein [Amycolatopsis camponoti]VVJ18376.1 Uncharacterised protein [Amycolatopsis camponoti]
MTGLTEETAYDRVRLAQWRAGEARLPGLSRRGLLRRPAGSR